MPLDKPPQSDSLPQDLVAERTLLGALSIGSSFAGEIFEQLKPEDFYLPQNRMIFQCFRRLWEDNREVSSLALYAAILADDPEMNDRCGGTAYWSSLGDGIVRVDRTIPELIKRVQIKRRLRQMASYADGLLQKSLVQGSDARLLADSAIEFFLSISESVTSSDDDATTERDAAANLLAQIPEAQKAVRVNTGVALLDDCTGGFLAGELVIITAETGVGKTFLALQTKREACKKGLHGLTASGEMLAEHLMARHLASISGVPHWKLRRTEKLTNPDYDRLARTAAEQCTHCRILDGELELQRIRMKARGMASRGELSWIIVDYDEMVDVRGCKDEWEEQKILVRSLKSLGWQLRVPVILISQLRKPPDSKGDKPPSLADLYGTGAKAKHASIVIYVQRKFVQKLAGDETEAKLWLLKCRDGRQGTVECTFNIKTLTFDQKPQQGELPKEEK